jgi:uncharacterized protein YjbI with pentapeptide repeats
VDIQGTVLKETVLKETVLKGTVLKGTVLKGTVLKGTVLKGHPTLAGTLQFHPHEMQLIRRVNEEPHEIIYRSKRSASQAETTRQTSSLS